MYRAGACQLDLRSTSEKGRSIVQRRGETAKRPNTTKNTTNRVIAKIIILYIAGVVKAFLAGLDAGGQGNHISQTTEEGWRSESSKSD